MPRLFAPKRVVYTVLFGDNEALIEQTCANRTGIEFICFTDSDRLSSERWRIERVATLGIDSARESRRPKLMPHLFLGAYGESLYIDNRIILKTDPADIFDRFLARGAPDFAVPPHPWRKCAYDEAEAVVAGGIDDERRVREQMTTYRRAGFPAKAGLNASGFLLRRHNAPAIRDFGERWFAHVLRYSKRDQLSFNFLAWREGFTFGTVDLRVDDNSLFTWTHDRPRVPYGFDPDEYLWLNPDVARAGVDPRRHMLEHGLSEKRRFRYRTPLTLDRLANKYGSDKGSLVHSGHFFTRVYEHYLSPLRTSEFTLLAIGLPCRAMQARADNDARFDDAPSLFMWDAYFERAQIHGVGSGEFSSGVRGKISVTSADPSNVDDLATAVERCRHEIRVVVDDGSHAVRDQQTSLAFLFPRLAPGGLYFIEDPGCRSPQPEPAPRTVDILRALADGKRPRSPFIAEADIIALQRDIAEIRFHDSMDYMSRDLGSDALAVIRKR